MIKEFNNTIWKQFSAINKKENLEIARLDKLASTVRETGVSQHNGGSIENPLKPSIS